MHVHPLVPGGKPWSAVRTYVCVLGSVLCKYMRLLGKKDS